MMNNSLEVYKDHGDTISEDNAEDASVFSDSDTVSITSLVSPSVKVRQTRTSYKGLVSNEAKIAIIKSLLSPEGQLTFNKILTTNRAEYGITSSRHVTAIHSFKQYLKKLQQKHPEAFLERCIEYGVGIPQTSSKEATRSEATSTPASNTKKYTPTETQQTYQMNSHPLSIPTPKCKLEKMI
jgi:hypothetical protein